MKKVIIGISLVSLSFIAGQYSIMNTFDPNEWYESSMQLGRLSYEVGCNDGTVDTAPNQCKQMSQTFEKKLRAVKVESK